ncbi:hypothetical protein TgHK011_009944 [Trichoderma gracile]|nr:hypothetical protein TgHK011_009944 [Trichoderma gracile]
MAFPAQCRVARPLVTYAFSWTRCNRSMRWCNQAMSSNPYYNVTSQGTRGDVLVPDVSMPTTIASMAVSRGEDATCFPDGMIFSRKAQKLTQPFSLQQGPSRGEDQS